VTRPVRYLKGHGTQNDFVLLPDPDEGLDLTPALVRALCDRRVGLGADGVLRVVPSESSPAGSDGPTWFMDHRNADGSTAEMCGNGLRLFARYLVHSGLSEPGELRIATRAGVRRTEVRGDGTVRVEMGQAIVGVRSMARAGGREFAGTAVSMGNPHLVCLGAWPVADLDLSRPPEVDGAMFPDGVNVEFGTVGSEYVDGVDSQVRMRVHERGVGETRACGTGACAVAAAVLGGATGVVAVDQPGGRVLVEIEGGNSWLTGPAVFVAEGTLDPAWLSAIEQA